MCFKYIPNDDIICTLSTCLIIVFNGQREIDKKREYIYIRTIIAYTLLVSVAIATLEQKKTST